MGMRVAGGTGRAACALMAGVSLIALMRPALAADLPMTKAPPPAVMSSWAGFYLGVDGGYGWAKDNYVEPFSLVTSTQHSINGVASQGAVYGVHGGYNWQFGRAVTGFEVDFDPADIKGSNGASETAVRGRLGADTVTVTQRENIQYLGSARARLGWLPSDNWLLYGTAGLAWGRFDTALDESSTFSGTSFFSSTRTPFTKFGWVAGLGTEVMLGSPHWIGRVEYLHYQFSALIAADSFSGPTLNRSASTSDQTVDVVRAGISYRFGDPAQPVPHLYTKAPVAAPLANWAGFYLGVHGGYAWADDPTTQPAAVLFGGGTDVISGTKYDGWVAGGHFGYNWQYDRVVTGFEADLSAANLKGATNVGRFGADSLSFDENVHYLGTLRGRLGWLPTNNVLLYGTAGLAWERFDLAETDSEPQLAGIATERSNTPSDQFGWVAGIGGEVMLGSTNWLGRLEYLHYDFGHVLGDDTEGAVSTTSGHQTIDLVRAGLSYKFGEKAPAAAYAMAGKVPQPMLQSWAGFYLGGHAGYGWKDNDISSDTIFAGVFPIGGIRSQGWLAGGHAGYNWQYANAVAGIEIDGTATGIESAAKASILQTAPGIVENASLTVSDDVKYLGTLRGRVGWTPAGGWLLYSTGGLAWEHADRTQTFGVVAGETSTLLEPRDLFGWVAGAGVETFIGSSNWITRLEYLHYDFGNVERTTSYVQTAPAFTSSDHGGHQTIETVRAGVSYKFTP